MSCLLLLAACQPQVLEVEVTRIVPETAVSPIPATPLEVTRLVPREVTRIIPQEVQIEIEVTPVPLGEDERPVQLLFPPVADTAVILARAEPLLQALESASGRQFEAGILDDEQRLIELLCAAPADTVGFLSAPGYVLAQAQCGAEVTAVGVNATGQPWQMGMIVVRNDGGITSLTDLEGKSWAVPDESSLPEFLYFQALLAEAGVTAGEIIAVPGDSSAMLAVLNGEADFATGTYIPPVMPYAASEWEYGVDDPEIWRETGILPGRSGIGFIIVNGGPDNGGYWVRDARAGIYDTNRTVFQDTEVLTLSQPFPNETIAFGADFPLGLARQVTAVLLDFGASEACATSLCATDMLGWSGIIPATDAEYEPIRLTVSTLGLPDVDLLKEP